MKALNFGSLNLDYVYQVPHFVQPGETLSALSQGVFPGGKGLNQSVALAKAGAEVWHAGCLGQGGEMLEQVLLDSGDAAADELDEARTQAAPRFADEVSAVMARLEMGGAELVCDQRRLDRASWTKAGPSQFEFMYRPGSGMQARPLARIASGGEVSRVMLAIKVVLGAQDDVDTLVFDEVDAGVGGAVAVALADVIAELALTHQVIIVTHLAQVAVRGDVHYVVRRERGEAGIETRLSSVSGEQRVAEIARMLSGDVSDASLAHARELLTR